MGRNHSKEINELSNQIENLNMTLREDRDRHQQQMSRLHESFNQMKIDKDEKRSEQITELRRDALALKPGCTLRFSSDKNFPDVLNVGIFGAPGIGKTSLLNSLIYTVMGSLKPMHRIQTAAPHHHGAHTTVRFAVNITRHITFIDNRGMSAEDLGKEAVLNVIEEQLHGRGSFGNEVKWLTPQENPKERRDQKIFCSVLVFNGRSPDGVRNIISPIAQFFKKWQGRYPIAVITHVDVATPEQLENMRMVIHSAGMGDVYEVANITDTKNELEPKYQINLLEFLQMCMNHGDRTYEYRQHVEEL